MTKNEINRVFTYQSKWNDKYKVHKDLFNLTADFTIDDWRMIRDENFYKASDKMKVDNKKQFLLKRVRNYLEVR